MNKRTFLKLVALTLGSSSSVISGLALAIPPDSAFEKPDVVDMIDEDGNIPTIAEYEKTFDLHTGPKNPFTEEIKRGNEMIKATIPTNVTPYEVALKFWEWRQGKVSTSDITAKEFSYYAREWPIRGNPVIMQFFYATDYRKPEGDTTWWCSAFVSWCIRHAREGRSADNVRAIPVKGAASSQYRDWGEEIKLTEAKKGDLVVFKNKSKPAFGHIGFFHELKEENGEKIILVLGGNQAAQDEFNGGEVNIARYKLDSERLEFHSVRRDVDFQKV